jgi:hypothetical protein
MDESDVKEARKFMGESFPPELCSSLEWWIPTARLIFSIDGWDISFSRSESEKIPVLEFAAKLNELLHNIQVGEKVRLSLTMDSYNKEFVRTDDKTVMIDSWGEYDGQPVLTCALSDLQTSSAIFCRSLYEAIVKDLPGYFEMMDRRPEEKARPAKTASELIIQQLLLIHEDC